MPVSPSAISYSVASEIAGDMVLRDDLQGSAITRSVTRSPSASLQAQSETWISRWERVGR